MATKHLGKEIGISAHIIMKYHLLVLTFNLVFQIHSHRYWKGNFLPRFPTDTKPDSISLSQEEGGKASALLNFHYKHLQYGC